MGVVWRAHDELLSRDVAVKELLWPAYLSEAEQQAACRRASREARMTARLSHRNVIRVFDFFEEDGRPWLVMELLPHGSLHDLIKEQGRLSPVRVAGIGLEILAALRAAHAEDILHRDVKPANILVAPDRVVLTDFGIALPASVPAVTTAGTLVGSPSYTAPERAMTGQSGPAGDLWGLGASLYAAVEGHGPFDRDGGALASLTAVVADEPAPAVHAGPLLWPVISGLLRKDPDRRMDAAEAERLLRRAAGIPVAPVSRMTPRPWHAQVPAAALAGSAALAALAVSGTLAALTLTSPPRAETAALAPIAPAASAPAKTPAGPRPATRTPQSPAPRRTAATTSSAIQYVTAQYVTTSSTAENAGPGTVRRGRSTGRTRHFAVSVPHPGWHADRWPGITAGQHRAPQPKRPGPPGRH